MLRIFFKLSTIHLVIVMIISIEVLFILFLYSRCMAGIERETPSYRVRNFVFRLLGKALNIGISVNLILSFF